MNFGCPQDIARKGRYGAYLCDDWDLIHKLSKQRSPCSHNETRYVADLAVSSVNILHVNVTVPVTAKFRIFSDVDKTVKYAKMMESAGAQILTCHGRTRDQRGHNSVCAFFRT